MTGPLHVAHSSVSYLRGKGDGAVPHCTIKLNKVGGSDSSVNGDGTKSSTGVELGVSQKKHRRPPDPVLDAKHDDNSDMLSIKSYNSYGGYDEEDKMSIKSSKSGKSAGSHHKHSKKSIKKI